MTKLVWNKVGERFFEVGVDQGVLYLNNTVGVVWNGLIEVEEQYRDSKATPSYFDGMKQMDVVLNAEFRGRLTAYTYPDEFNAYNGYLNTGSNWLVDNQNSKTFGLSYRTLIGNDVAGMSKGYRIHILYNLKAVPTDVVRKTIGKEIDTVEFSWDITGMPDPVVGFRPTAHVIIDSRTMDSDLLIGIENLLYGSAGTSAYLPTLQELVDYASSFGTVIITDNFNGTWTATAPDGYITMTDATTFQITGVNAVYLDADTYQVSTT